MKKKQCSIIMYHYIRDLPNTKYQKIKAILIDQFKNQLDYFSRYYEFVNIHDCINAVYSNGDLPDNAVLLTFDDAYLEHYEIVFPELMKRKIQGCFFPSSILLNERKVLDVNKIQFVLSMTEDRIEDLLNDIYIDIDKYRNQYNLKSIESYFSDISLGRSFDNKEISFVKYLMQGALPHKLSNLMVDELFKKYVTTDEEGFSQELYIDSMKLKEMKSCGMYIGCHGYDHLRLDRLSFDQQVKEIDMALDVLKKNIGVSNDNWVMCYPSGMYNDSLINVIKEKGCKLAVTTKTDIAKISLENAYTLERLDATDFPLNQNDKPNKWTQNILTPVQ